MLSNTSRVDSLDMFRISVADKVKKDIYILQKVSIQKKIILKYNMQINMFNNCGWGIPQNLFTCSFNMKRRVMTHR